MKKTFFFMSLLLGLMVSSFALTACGDDDDDDNSSSNPLVGTWEQSSSNYWEEYTFNSNYSVVYREQEGSRPILTETGTYKIEGNKLTMTWKTDEGDFTEGYSIFSVSGNTLTLIWHDDDGSTDGEKMVYKKK